MRNYIKQIEDNAIMKEDLTEELSNWIKWASDKANWYDPLINGEDELLNDSDREDLHKPKQPNNYYR
jgi:hypothetical protein